VDCPLEKNLLIAVQLKKKTSFKCAVIYYLHVHFSGLSTYYWFSLYRKAETFKMCSSNDQVSISLSEGDTSDPPGTTSSDMKTVPKEAVLSFRITSYRVKQKIGFLHGRKTVEIEVLSNIKYVHELSR
jgi:hypothetical protein